MWSLIQATIARYVAPGALLTGIEPLPPIKQGYSGSPVRVYEVAYTEPTGTARRVRLLVKDAPPIERRVLDLLARQGHPAVPFSCSPGSCNLDSCGPDLSTEAFAPVCQQWIEPTPGLPSQDSLARAAEALAGIHHANLGRRADLAWLPPGDRAYYQQLVDANWRPHWRLTLADPEFAYEYGGYTDRLEAAARRFVGVMDDLWRRGDALTLIHADLHSEHVLVDSDGRPYLIDWGQARYGCLYVDLPNYFPLESALAYRERLAELGHAIDRGEFVALYHEAGRYVGFKYLSFVCSQWRLSGTSREWSRTAFANLLGMTL